MADPPERDTGACTGEQLEVGHSMGGTPQPSQSAAPRHVRNETELAKLKAAAAQSTDTHGGFAGEHDDRPASPMGPTR